MTILQDHLSSINACQEAREWARERSPQEAWEQSPRADWLLWWAGNVDMDRRLLVRAACTCARTALKYLPEGETRPLRAIKTAEAWCEGKATLEEVLAAAAAAVGGAASRAPLAAGAASRAAWTALVARAASRAALAARAASWAALAALAAGATHVDLCNLIRSIIPWEEMSKHVQS